MNNISKKLREHYEKCFVVHGATPEGVDWGDDQGKLDIRYLQMLKLIKPEYLNGNNYSLLDVGCGFSGFLSFLLNNGFDVEYTGIDISEKMIDWATENQNARANFLVGDILESNFEKTFDFVICNGIFTQKLDVEAKAMDSYFTTAVRKMYDLCEIGVAFNIMTNKVNYYSNNLYYRSPAEVLTWCMDEVTTNIVVDHSYPLYEYTMYLYKECE